MALGIVESRLIGRCTKYLSKYEISSDSEDVKLSEHVFYATVLAVAAMQVPLRDPEQV